MPTPRAGARADRVRRHVRVRGLVQGVGFRYTARSMAARFAVAGYVRNLPDGRVEMVVEGTPEETEAFLAAVRREMCHYIAAVQETAKPATGRLHGFEVRF